MLFRYLTKVTIVPEQTNLFYHIDFLTYSSLEAKRIITPFKCPSLKICSYTNFLRFAQRYYCTLKQISI